MGMLFRAATGFFIALTVLQGQVPLSAQMLAGLKAIRTEIGAGGAAGLAEEPSLPGALDSLAAVVAAHIGTANAKNVLQRQAHRLHSGL